MSTTDAMVLDAGTALVGLVGTGVMGRAVGTRLLGAGGRLLVHNRTRQRAEEVLAAGGEWRDAPGELARECDVVLTLVGFPEELAELYAGPDGLLECARPGTYLVDLGTSSPAVARQLAERARAAGLHALDAPVSGSEAQAREGRLLVTVGGEESAFRVMAPLLERLGRVLHMGGAGSGQAARLCEQVALAGEMIGLSEALAFARAAGLDGERVLQALEQGSTAGAALDRYGARMLRGDLEGGFRGKHFLKDMRIALEQAEAADLDLPGVELAHMMYEELAEMGLSERGIQSIVALWQDEDDGGELVQLSRR